MRGRWLRQRLQLKQEEPKPVEMNEEPEGSRQPVLYLDRLLRRKARWEPLYDLIAPPPSGRRRGKTPR